MTAAPRLVGVRTARVLALALWLVLGGGAGATAVAAPLPVTEIAPGVFVHLGAQEEASAQNLGDIANIGFIVGAQGVAVIDTGGSYRVGEGLREAVRQVTALPIRYVILTHMHPDHIFGAAAFAEDDAEIVGHARLGPALAQRSEHYLSALRQTLGEEAAGTRVVVPTLTVSDRLDLDLGGRTLELRAHPTAHTDNDLSVFDPTTKTLWLSDLLFRERIPVLDGSLTGWLAVLDQLDPGAVEHVVPGHGSVASAWPAAAAGERRYLQVLAAETRRALAQGVTLGQAVAEVGQSERGRWLLFDAYHPRNVTAAYVELEWED